MTFRHDFTLPAEMLEQIASQGVDVLLELIVRWSTPPCKPNEYSTSMLKIASTHSKDRSTPTKKTPRLSRDAWERSPSTFPRFGGFLQALDKNLGSEP